MIIARLILLAVLATPLHAQMRRQAEPGAGSVPAAAPARLVIPNIAPDPARPFVGAWQGKFRGPFNDTAAMSVIIEFTNGAYVGYSAIGPEAGLHPHRTDAVAGDSIVWTQPNSGGGTLVYIARIRGNILAGEMLLRDGGPPELSHLKPTFSLRRVVPAGGNGRR